MKVAREKITKATEDLVKKSDAEYERMKKKMFEKIEKESERLKKMGF